MRSFNYSAFKEQKWDSGILGLIAAIYKEAGKQEQYLKQRPQEMEKLVEMAKIQSTEASNAIEGIVTTNTRIKQLVEEKTTPRNRDEQEIAGYRDVLNVIHESFDAIPITQNYILQLHKMLYSHMNNPLAGRTKSVQNYISAAYPDGHTEILFTSLAPNETSEAPKKDGSLKNFANEDWSDPEFVESARQKRIQYIEDDRSICDLVSDMKNKGCSTEEIAHSICDYRNQTRLNSYLDLDGNIINENGYNAALERMQTRSYDALISSGKTPEQIISSSMRTNPAMDACVGLYDENFNSY